MSQKTNKSFTKRLKVSSPKKKADAKVVARKKGFNHFNSKADGRTRQAGRNQTEVNLSRKQIDSNMPHARA